MFPAEIAKDVPPSFATSEKSGAKEESLVTVVEALDNQRNVSGNVLDGGLCRGLKGRHIVFIALGSIIGPGTFYGLGYGLSLSGPLGCLLGFGITGMLPKRQWECICG
jgi:amino acid transporter